MDGKLLTLYSEVQTRPVKWLWFPYIAYGKITLLQGDPGDGKSTMMLHLIAELSSAGTLPDGTCIDDQKRVIYQCSEDGAGDTIKPRLVKLGANCKNVAFINEEYHGELTLDDERIREAMAAFKPQLLVIDPVQAYIGNDTDLLIAGRARKLMRRLAAWAEAYDCAIVLIGHMNKRESAKGLYRGLGSIDLIAAARSVLQVERCADEPDKRTVRQIKNSLERDSGSFSFQIHPVTGFEWLGCMPQNREQSRVSDSSESLASHRKIDDAADYLTHLLSEDDKPSTELFHMLGLKGITVKTARAVKEQIGARAYRKGGKWYWTLKDKDRK